jgi:hypothetical protein
MSGQGLPQDFGAQILIFGLNNVRPRLATRFRSSDFACLALNNVRPRLATSLPLHLSGFLLLYPLTKLTFLVKEMKTVTPFKNDVISMYKGRKLFTLLKPKKYSLLPKGLTLSYLAAELQLEAWGPS